MVAIAGAELAIHPLPSVAIARKPIVPRGLLCAMLQLYAGPQDAGTCRTARRVLGDPNRALRTALYKILQTNVPEHVSLLKKSTLSR